MGYIKLTQKPNGVVNINALLVSFTHDGVTHQNRQDRYGIPENIWIAEFQYRINNGSWIKKPNTSSADVTSLKNGDKVEVSVLYRYDTQGYHHKNTDLPFFYYSDDKGNVAGHKGKTNGTCPWPNNGVNGARNYCKMPNNWNPVGGGKSDTSLSWTDWAKSHSNTSDKLWWISGPQHEQRSANAFGNASDGWFSEQGSWNYYRRSCLWRWECRETATIVYSGASTPPPSTGGNKLATPEIIIHDAYGASGKVTCTNKDNSNSGHMKLGAWLKDGKEGPNIDGTWRWVIDGRNGVQANNTGIVGSKWGPGYSTQVNIDFYELFGEKYEGKKVYYQLSIESESGVDSNLAETHGWHHHFNARPTIPNVTLNKNGNSLNGSWSAIDPDPRGQSTALEASLLTYDVELEIDSGNGKRNEVIATKTQSTSTNIPLKEGDEGSSYVLRVRSHDGRIYSKDWGYSNKSVQSFKAMQPRIVFPMDDSIIYNTTPRVVIRTEAKGSSDILVVKFNGRTYKSNSDSDCFSSEYIPKGVNHMIFKPKDSGTGKITMTTHSENEGGSSVEHSSSVIINSLDLRLDNEYVGATDFMNLEKHISNVSNAYGLDEYYTDGAYGYICAEDANVHMEHLYNIDRKIRKMNSSFAPDIETEVKKPGVSYITANDYNGIVRDLKNM